MTTTTESPTDGTPAAALPAPRADRPGRADRAALRLTFPRVLRSEWIKLRTLRSTWVSLASVLVVMIGIGAIASAVSTGSVTPGNGGPPRGTDPLSIALVGANFGVLLLGVIGCLAGAREYGSRMITATVAAVPRRWPVVLAKALALVGFVLPVAVVGVLGAFGLGMAIISSGGGTTVALSGAGVLRAVIGMALWLTVVSLLGFALGVLLRSTAASIGTLIGGVLILPGIAGALLPDSWQTILKFLPTNAAESFTTVTTPSGDLGVVGGAVTLGVWLVVAIVGAVVTMRRRDV